ncbi:MAG: glycosyltransferase family 39 protein [bacterium]|nr:glycosyltransferase family 39 protein [bacterium]
MLEKLKLSFTAANKFFFIIILVQLLLLAFLMRIIPAWDNNFYFTMDQGHDAVWVRELIVRDQILLLGPQTGIEGVFAGPLWFYFIGLGYLLFGGNPFGSVFMLIVLNLSAAGFLAVVLRRRISSFAALFVLVNLIFFWPFYNVSRYGFNPFPLVSLSILTVFLLTFSFEGKSKYYLWAAIPVGLAFHTEVAFAIALALFYLFVGVYLFIKKKISIIKYFLGLLVFLLFFVPHLISEIQTNFSQLSILLKEFFNPNSTVVGLGLNGVIQNYLKTIGEAVFAQNKYVGLFILLITFYFFFKRKDVNQWAGRFIKLSSFLIIVSAFWFATNRGLQEWHLVAVPVLVFISLLLMLGQITKKIAILIFSVVFISQMFFFWGNYVHYFRPFDDPSLLHNEIGVVDWVYQKAENKGFSVYSYLPSVYDYPYQYLFWWEGTRKYSYVPCEYSSFPGSPSLFVPGKRFYQTPQKECTNIRFLVIEPDKNMSVQNEWLKGVREGTELIEQTKIGGIVIEKRSVTNQI